MHTKNISLGYCKYFHIFSQKTRSMYIKRDSLFTCQSYRNKRIKLFPRKKYNLLIYIYIVYYIKKCRRHVYSYIELNHFLWSLLHFYNIYLLSISACWRRKHHFTHFVCSFFLQLPDAKDLHNMSLVGSYGTHLLHSFHPHLLQTLNHGMLAANSGPASYFANDRGLGKPSVLSNFQLPSAFSPPKYIGISLDQVSFVIHITGVFLHWSSLRLSIEQLSTKLIQNSIYDT